MSENRLLDEEIEAGWCPCGGTTWSRLDDNGHYYQCEECGSCFRDNEGTIEFYPGRDL